MQDNPPCVLSATIRRHLLDFDFQKVCSISFSNNNVYCCLVCGRYFQGKGKSTYAYEHSLEHNHYLFISLDSGKVYVLPENVEFNDQGLEDVKYNLSPKYSPQSIEQIGGSIQTATNLDGNPYVRGVVGINNLKHTEYANTVLVMLSQIKEVYSFFLLEDYTSGMLGAFGRLVKRVWSIKNFKGLVSPHEFMQKLSDDSNKKFQIGHKSEPLSLFIWLVNRLEEELKQCKSTFSIKKLFSGKLKISSFKPFKNSAGYQDSPYKVQDCPFLMLSLQMPDQKQKVSDTTIMSLLARYQALAPHDTPQSRKYYLITKYPQYLMLVLKRFKDNNFFKQKNSNIIRFPLQFKIQHHTYRMVSNICHEGPVDSGTYKIYVLRVNKWFLVQDLQVEEALPKEVTISESYIQLYQKL